MEMVLEVNLKTLRSFWDHLGLFGTIWDHLGPFGAIFASKCKIVADQSRSRKYTDVTSGPFGIILDISGQYLSFWGP